MTYNGVHRRALPPAAPDAVAKTGNQARPLPGEFAVLICRRTLTSRRLSGAAPPLLLPLHADNATGS